MTTVYDNTHLLHLFAAYKPKHGSSLFVIFLCSFFDSYADKKMVVDDVVCSLCAIVLFVNIQKCKKRKQITQQIKIPL